MPSGRVVNFRIRSFSARLAFWRVKGRKGIAGNISKRVMSGWSLGCFLASWDLGEGLVGVVN